MSDIFPATDKSALYCSEGLVRATAPADSLSRALVVAKKIGVTRVANVTGLDRVGIPVAIAIRPNSRFLSVAQGKGMTHDAAQVSALMESIETWHAENLSPSECRESYSLSSNQDFLQPSLLAQSFYRPNILDHLLLGWHQGMELISGRPIYIPTDILNLNNVERTKSQLMFGTSSNGLSSGNTKEEALCYGILEVLERDAHAFFEDQTLEVQQAQQIDFNSIQSTLVQKLLPLFETARLRVSLYDLSERHAVPTFLCTLNDPDMTQATNYFMGMSAHYLKEIALVRAMTEAAQVRLTYITGSRDDVFPSVYDQIQAPRSWTTGHRDFQKIPELTQAENFPRQLTALLQHLSGRNIKQIAYFDHTHPEFQIPVVHVVIPGMRGYS